MMASELVLVILTVLVPLASSALQRQGRVCCLCSHPKLQLIWEGGSLLGLGSWL